MHFDWLQFTLISDAVVTLAVISTSPTTSEKTKL